VGGTVALLIQVLRKIWPPLPMVAMGATAALAGVFAAYFPETTGLDMPDSVTQAEALGEGEEGGVCESLVRCNPSLSPFKVFAEKEVDEKGEA